MKKSKARAGKASSGARKITPSATAKPAASTRSAKTSRPVAAAAGKARRPAAKATAAPDPAAMMAAWQAAMTPGEAHRRLEPLVGTFSTRNTFWMAPGAPPDSSTGVSEHRWVLGGRFIEQVFKGTAMGMPFEGLGFTGYDNAQKKYVGTWMDSCGTGIMRSAGTGKATAREIVFAGQSFDPSRGREVSFESVVRIQDADHHSYEMWCEGPDGKRFRTMLCEYTRK